MARKTRVLKRPQAKRSEPAWLRGAVNWTFSMRGGRTALWILTVGAAIYSVYLLEQRAFAATNSGDLEIRWVRRPAVDPTYSEHLLRELSYKAGVLPSDTVHTQGLAERVAGNLLDEPWVAQLNHVRILPPIVGAGDASAAVEIDAEFRKPLTWVVQHGNAHLIDVDGIRLPVTRPAAEISADWFVIVGARAAAPALGEPWRGEDVAAGIKLVKLLEQAAIGGRLECRQDLRAVDVSNFDRRIDPRAGRLRLVTANPDVYIHWGLPPGEEYSIEASAEQKLHKLNTLHRAGRLLRSGNLDLRGEGDAMAVPY